MKEIINGLSVFVEGNSKNKSIIFLHGFPYDHTMWKAQIDELSENYFCVTYDIRGLGESVSYTHLRAHETVLDLVCRLLLEKKIKE